MKTLISTAIATLGIATAALIAPAQAYELTGSPDCKSGSITGYTQCSGSYTLGGGENDVTNGDASNIATQLLNNQDLFGSKDWTFGAKYDGVMSGSNANGLKVNGIGSTSGSFSFSNIDLAKTDIAVSLKAAKGFSLYYIKAGTITDASQIQWSTAGTSVNKKGAVQGLSHLSYFTRIAEIPQPPARVPEPTAISALLLIGGAALRRKQSSGKA